MNFDDKVVLVTGASRGIGRAIALEFARRGGRVALNYQSNRTAVEETHAMLPGIGHSIVQADVSDPQAVQRMVEYVAKEMGGLHLLVNNAAIYQEHPIAAVSYEYWQKDWLEIINTNLIGAANACYCAAQHMIKHGGGRIVNVSSRGAFRGEPESPAYGASKAGLNALSQSLAKALAPHNIFVGVVAPGWVETDMAEDYLNGPNADFIRNESPLRRVARPQEVAYVVAFLASEGAEFATGSIIDVNGASYLRT
ncbi:MAG TPA: SDR family oxidoreductase [Aggregatilineales bacterium]|nr:SDR family oxidoreductase [Aggregatilineales bacterium]